MEVGIKPIVKMVSINYLFIKKQKLTEPLLLCAGLTVNTVCMGNLATNRMSITKETKPVNDYWSSSPNANNSNNAWIVNFKNGNDNNNNRNNNNHVRLVRGGA